MKIAGAREFPPPSKLSVHSTDFHVRGNLHGLTDIYIWYWTRQPKRLFFGVTLGSYPDWFEVGTSIILSYFYWIPQVPPGRSLDSICNHDFSLPYCSHLILRYHSVICRYVVRILILIISLNKLTNKWSKRHNLTIGTCNLSSRCGTLQKDLVFKRK
jgi:hypothetical protein